MEARSLAAIAAVLLTLVLGAQLAFTTVGQPVGDRWADPTPVVEVPSDDGTVEAVAAAGDSGSGAVAWLVRTGEQYRVSYAPVTVEAGRVTLGERRTVVAADRELRGLDVAVEGDDVALTWERAVANDIVLYRPGSAQHRVVSDDPLRVAEPSVVFVDGVVVLGWQQWTDPGFGVELAAVSERDIHYRSLDVATGGTGSPALARTGDGFAVTWFDADSRSARTAFGTIDSGTFDLASPQELGRAQPAGGFGGGSGSVAIAAGADGEVVRAVWLDLATVTTAETRRGGTPSEPRSLGSGDRPAVAVEESGWLGSWIVDGRAADTDLQYAIGGEDVGTGTLSRFESSANHPSPFYAPDAAVAWSERGGQNRVLVSGLQDASDRRIVDRVRAEPGRLAFIGIAAAALGVVTLPIMPWVFVSVLVAFYLTNRFIRTRAVRVVAVLAGLAGRPVGEPGARDRLKAVPPAAWAAGFAVGEVAVLVYLLPSVGASVPLAFAAPVVLSVGAGVGTGLVQLVVPQRSPWRLIALFAYFQTAALWATALPDVL